MGLSFFTIKGNRLVCKGLNFGPYAFTVHFGSKEINFTLLLGCDFYLMALDALDKQIQLSFRGYFGVSTSRLKNRPGSYKLPWHFLTLPKASVQNSAEYSINITTVESYSVEMNHFEETWMVLFYSRLDR